MQPILDRIIVRRVDDPFKKPSTIIRDTDNAEITIETPEIYRQQSRWGKVIAIGQGVVLGDKFFPLTDFVNVGDTIMFGEYNAEPFQTAEEELVLIRVQDIRGRV